MIIPDINLLIYSFDSDSRYHEQAQRWLSSTVASGQPLGIPMVVVLGFIRLTTKRTVFANPLSVVQAQSVIDELFTYENVTVVRPASRHLKIFFELLTEVGAAGNLTTDAHIAALAIEHRATVASNDTDFFRFPKVRVLNPLQ